MEGQAPLSELCSICFTEKPKYRCPRCKTQTCSLPCYQKHQQRASCSGKRDPAAYLKKNQVATPSGLDRDYNYLKNVERSIDHASQDAQDRGIGFSKSTSKNVARGWRMDSALQRYLEQNHITVEHAPRGMSRQKFNQTRPTKSNRIVWTVEWVTATGDRSTRHDCAESDSVASLYETHLIERHSATRNPNGSKRKRSEVDASDQKHVPGNAVPQEGLSSSPVDTQSLALTEMTKPEQGTPDAADTEPGANISEASAVERPVSLAEHTTNPELEMARSNADSVAAQYLPEGKHDPTEKLTRKGITAVHTKAQVQQVNAGIGETAHAKPQLHFYLLKPATSSASKVVIPLPPDATLTECLRNQAVQEYPTIVVLDTSRDSLPEGFVAHEDYVKSSRREAMEPQPLVGASSDLGLTSAPSNSRPQVEAEELDAQSILNMLKRDVRT